MIEWGVAAWTLPGQTRSGDRYVVQDHPAGVLVAVADGLGHGDEAAEAAELAVRTAAEHAEEPLITLVKRCHDRLRETRGVVMSLASLNARDGTLTWMGIGNVEGLLWRPGAAPSQRYEVLLLRGGVVGVQLPPLQAAILPILPGEVLLFVTDGVSSGFTAGLGPGDPPQQMAERLLLHYNRSIDDALVLVARPGRSARARPAGDAQGAVTCPRPSCSPTITPSSARASGRSWSARGSRWWARPAMGARPCASPRRCAPTWRCWTCPCRS